MNTDILKRLSAIAETDVKSSSSDDFLEKYTRNLVELVVNECSNICVNFRFSDEGPSENAAYQRSLCSVEIKERFGLTTKGPVSSKLIR